MITNDQARIPDSPVQDFSIDQGWRGMGEAKMGNGELSCVSCYKDDISCIFLPVPNNIQARYPHTVGWLYMREVGRKLVKITITYATESTFTYSNMPAFFKNDVQEIMGDLLREAYKVGHRFEIEPVATNVE